MLPSSGGANTPPIGSSPTKASGVTGIRRANMVLARYGGEAGPTGVAAGPRGATDSPVSLANFMGGRAAGPRLGKLTGDGKNAPPEASLIHESRGVALPGLANPSAQYGGRSLASFLGDRADSLGHTRPVKTMSTSPTKSAPSSNVPTRSITTDESTTRSTSPAKYTFSQAELGRPPKAATDMQVPLSPKKAYLELVEKQQTSASTTPVLQRPSSPVKTPSFGSDKMTTAISPASQRPPSPTKKSSYLNSGSKVPDPVPVLRHDSHSDAANAQALTTSFQRLRSSDSLPVSRSSELSGSERPPQPTLTRLETQKSVKQRIEEAQLRDAAAKSQSEAERVSSARSVPSSPAVRERWPPSSTSSSNLLSPNAQTREGAKPVAYSPIKYGNALPGLASRSPIKESSSFSFGAALHGQEEVSNQSRAEPVRLPGLGGSVSPFQRNQAIPKPSDEQQSPVESVLAPLTKDRARGPPRRGAPLRSSQQVQSKDQTSLTGQADAKYTSTSTAAKSGLASSAAASRKPPRRTTGPRIHVLISGSGSNLQSLIDATLKEAPPGIPKISDGQISFVLSNRKAAYGLVRAADSNPPIPTQVLSLKTWQTRNPGCSREDYDQVLARAVLDGSGEAGGSTPPDLIVLAGFMHIVSETFLHALGHKTSLPSNTPTLGQRPSKPVPIINLHPALPHAFDGANAIPRALEAYKEGLVTKTGCMVHEVVADVDRGRPIIVREVPILPSYTLEDLEEAIHKIEHVIIVEAADLVLKGHLERLML